MIRLWTIQPLTVWQILQRDGVFHTDPAQSTCKDEYPEAYDWIVRRLTLHAGPAPDGCELPIWAWYHWHGPARPRPDLRNIRHHYGQGKWVRIELELCEKEVLLSDFLSWHYCMCYWYLPKSRKDDRQFSKELRERGLNYYKTKPLSDPEYHARIEQSWERIFDLDWGGPGKIPVEDRWVQAVFWELRRDQVREVTHFHGT